MTHLRLAALAAAAALSGCVMADRSNGKPTNIPGAYEIGELPGQELNGSCGMFLFTPLPRARFVFFSDWQQNTALIKLNGNTIKLIDGDNLPADDKHMVRRAFTASDDARTTVEIAVAPETETMSDGSLIKSGLIRIRSAQGWMQIVPVAGAFACN